MEAGYPVAEEPYEITHDIHGSFDGPRNGRLRVSQKVHISCSVITFFLSIPSQCPQEVIICL